MAKYYIEYGGGLGDVFNQMYRRGSYNVLRDLKPGDAAKVALICHNPYAGELFKHHPKASQIELVECGYFHGEAENVAGREKWGLPAIGMNHMLPVKDAKLNFHPPEEDINRCLQILGGAILDGKRLVIISACAGESSRDLPDKLVEAKIKENLESGHAVVMVGRNYDRHGRQEKRYAPGADHFYDMIDQLTVPGVAWLLANNEVERLITCHSALNILAGHLNMAQEVYYPDAVYERHIRVMDQWSFWKDSPKVKHGTFRSLGY